MNHRFPASAFALAFLLTACSSQKDDEAGNDTNLSAPIVDNRAVGTAGEDVLDNAAQTNAAAPAAPDIANENQSREQIPLALRGRWGLVPADCEKRSDNKGLLVISGTTLGFYESRGTLKSITEWTPARLHADFDFTGEGMSWTREMELDLQQGGTVLVRRDHGEDAQPGVLRYRRCAG